MEQRGGARVDPVICEPQGTSDVVGRSEELDWELVSSGEVRDVAPTECKSHDVDVPRGTSCRATKQEATATDDLQMRDSAVARELGTEGLECLAEPTGCEG